MISQFSIFLWVTALILVPALGLPAQTEAPAESEASAETEAPAEKKQVLAKGDVERFIKTFADISQQLEALGESFENTQDPNEMEAIAANAKVQAILQQYGWETATFFQKMNVIAMGYAWEQMAVELAKMPAEQRTMMEQMMKQQMGGLDIHPDDAAMIKPHLAELTKLFESMQ